MQDARGLEVLDREECLLRLGRGGIGRVAVTMGALPAIFPINYAMLGEDVVFRTGRGTKLTAALERSVVAFEIDGSDAFSHQGWSVLVIGPAGPISERDELEVVQSLPLTPWVSKGAEIFVRIEGRLISGRDLSPERSGSKEWASVSADQGV